MKVNYFERSWEEGKGANAVFEIRKKHMRTNQKKFVPEPEFCRVGDHVEESSLART